MRITVVIPAYNEEKHIGALLDRIPQSIQGHEVKVIVVDDGSRDKTKAAARRHPNVRVIHHRTNLGKGGAAKTGCDAAYFSGSEVIVLMDADGQHRPEDIERLVKPLLYTRRKNDPPQAMVIGTRRFNREMPLAMRLGNKVLSAVLTLFFGMHVQDTQSGFRAFSHDVYPKIRWISPSYAMETEMLILGAQHNVEFIEEEIETIYLDNYKGTTPLDGLKILKTAIKWRLLWDRVYKSLEPFSA